ncbi:hypothetical protein BRD22_11735 [Halobacteriales archaeon SW_8_68_21]|nr:MAG: hypothetical protein BRD22_11735 [Halobacteriales archaeon SW_8_68_21]
MADDFELDHQATFYTLTHTGLWANELAHMTDDWMGWQGYCLGVPDEQADWVSKTLRRSRRTR